MMNEREGGQLGAAMVVHKRHLEQGFGLRKSSIEPNLRSLIADELKFTTTEVEVEDTPHLVQITAECWNFTLDGMAQHNDEIRRESRLATLLYVRELLASLHDLAANYGRPEADGLKVALTCIQKSVTANQMRNGTDGQSSD